MLSNSDRNPLSLMSLLAVSQRKPDEEIVGPDNAHEALWGVVDIRTTRPVQKVLERWPDHRQATERHRAIQKHVEMQAAQTRLASRRYDPEQQEDNAAE
eukprot:15101217-Alexandrium_andersonii.AAC.1